jgi:hypothetical protein
MRRLAFLALAGVITVAVLLAGSHHEPDARSAAKLTAPIGGPMHPPPSPSDLRRAARLFIEAFLDLETGRSGRATRAAVRRTTSIGFARTLLADAPVGQARKTPDRRRPSISLQATRLPHRPDLALVTGTAARASGPEPFAFLFVGRDGRWLAIAPAE